MKPVCTIIIPARHEEKTIRITLDALKTTLTIPYAIIVVSDTDRTDKTASIARTYARHHQHVEVISRINNHATFASALKLGWEKARGAYIVPVMADLCDDPDTINRMYQTIQKGWDIVCGSRYMKGGKKSGGPLIQSLFSYLVCTSLHFCTGIRTHDVTNSLKMYRASCAKQIRIQETLGTEVSMDMALQGHFMGFRMTEIPTTWKGRTIGHSKFVLIKRAPRYAQIYISALHHAIRNMLHLKYT